MRRGSIGVSYNKNSSLAKYISFFARDPRDRITPKLSHSFIIFKPIFNETSLIEATLKCQVVPLQHYVDSSEEFAIFEIKRKVISDAEINRALRAIYLKYSGSDYGYAQYPFWIWKWINALFGRKVSGTPWFKSGLTCSELCYYYFVELGGVFKTLMQPYNPDTITHYDIYKVVKSNPNLFAIVFATDYNF